MTTVQDHSSSNGKNKNAVPASSAPKAHVATTASSKDDTDRKLTGEEKKALFTAFFESDDAVTAAEAKADEALESDAGVIAAKAALKEAYKLAENGAGLHEVRTARVEAVKKIESLCGVGPFSFRGKVLRIGNHGKSKYRPYMSIDEVRQTETID